MSRDSLGLISLALYNFLTTNLSIKTFLTLEKEVPNLTDTVIFRLHLQAEWGEKNLADLEEAFGKEGETNSATRTCILCLLASFACLTTRTSCGT